MKTFLSAFILVFFLTGCDTVYKYIFLPPERVEYTLVPDKTVMEELGDTNYFVAKNGVVVGYDARNWKIELRYMPDYQLNTFEFPEESKAGIFSANPFTYGNWIDPALGYTPRRFSVFKVTILNYTASKLNFDPEISILQTDRGDAFNAYGREQKNAKYLSIEEYYKKRKGTSGIDEEVFESRMGIARRTMLYYGKPIYKGDSRDGLVIYDPIIDEVEKLKITIPKFVLGYDENNEPTDFIDLNFFFKQIPLDKENIGKFQTNISADTTVKSQQVLSGNFRLAQIKYVDDAQAGIFNKAKLPQIKDIWNPNPEGIANLASYIQTNSGLKVKVDEVALDEISKAEYDMLLITGVGTSPMIDRNIFNLVEFIEKGGIVVFDISNFKDGIVTSASKHFQAIAEQLKGNVQQKELNVDHPIFNSPKKLTGVPAGFESINGNIEPAFQLKGIFLDGKLAAISTGKSYSMLWADNEQVQSLDFGLNLAAYSVSSRKK